MLKKAPSLLQQNPCFLLTRATRSLSPCARVLRDEELASSASELHEKGILSLCEDGADGGDGARGIVVHGARAVVLDGEPALVAAGTQTADDLRHGDDAVAHGRAGAVVAAVLQMDVLHAGAEVVQGLQHIFVAVEVVAGVEDVAQGGRGGEQTVEGRRIVTERAGVVVVLDHHAEPLAGRPLYEGCNARYGFLDDGVVGALGNEAGYEEQLRPSLRFHERQRLLLGCLLRAVYVADVGNGTGMAEAEAVERAEPVGGDGGADINALVAKGADACGCLGKRDILLMGYRGDMVGEDGYAGSGLAAGIEREQPDEQAEKRCLFH